MTEKNRLTFGQQYQIAAAVKENTEQLGEGFCKYRNGMSDGRLAEKLTQTLGFTVSRLQAARVRTEVAGRIRAERVKGGARKGKAQGDIENLRRVVHELYGEVAQLKAIVADRVGPFLIHRNGNGAGLTLK